MQPTSRKSDKESGKHECLFCFSVFATAARLRRHSIVHSTEKNIFQCHFCESSFRLHNELLSHERTHKRTLADVNLKRCKICGVSCHEDDLIKHFKDHHEHYQCDLCKKVYRTKHHLKAHMATHINAREFKCPTCPKTFNFFSQLKRHKMSHSTAAEWCCEICGVGFKNKPNLAHHMRCHSGEKPFQCDQCDRCFSAKQSLRLHIRIHNGEKPYKCPWEQCSSAFNDLTTMKVHTRIHTNENPYICHLCGKTTKQASNLKSHYLHAHKIKDITSKTIRLNARLFEKCKAKNLPETGLLEILSQQVLGNFEKIENEKSIVNITKLNKLYSNESSTLDIEDCPIEHESKLETQLTKITNIELEANTLIKQETFVVCDIVSNNSFSDINTADVKTVIKQEMSDEVDDNSTIEQFKSLKNVGRSRANHKNNQIEKIIISPKRDTLHIEEVFVDEQNNFILSNVFEIKEEILKDEENIKGVKVEDNTNDLNYSDSKTTNRTEENKMFLSPPSSTYNNDSPVEKLRKRESSNRPLTCRNSFKCDICSQSFKVEMQLKRHMLKHTSTANDKVKICEVCGKTFSQNSALKKHLMYTHSNYRPYPCEICNRAFKNSSGLKVHLRSHSGEKPYPCSFCEKSFSTSMGRNLHQRSHTGEKPYQCQYCGSSFSDNSTYRQHLRVHTGEKPYVCHLCGRGTTQAGNLKSHLRHAHKLQIKNVSMTRT